MRRVAAVAIALACAGGAATLAQEEFGFLGRYEDAKAIIQPKEDTNQFVFVRLIYNGLNVGYIKNWYTDYPASDRFLIMGLKRWTNIDIADRERAIAITDPDLFKYPFLYTSEPGQMMLTKEDASILREYLDRGGFWMLDDFWGTFEWANMEAQMKKVYPEAEIKNIPRDHPIFHSFFDITKVIQVPSLAYVQNPGRITYEQDGWVAECKGIWDAKGRLVVVINHNTDLGDAYEHADVPEYANVFGGYAYRMAVNTIIYALTN